MWIRTTRRGPCNIVALILFPGMALSLAGCGDAGSPPSSTTSSAQAQGTPTTIAEKLAGGPTEIASDGWMTFISEADGFEVDMPGEPQTSTRSTDSALGELTFHFFQITDDKVHYAVSYNAYPAEMTAEDLNVDQESVLEDALAATAQGSDAENVQRIEVQGNPAIEGEATIQEANHVWYRGILVENHLYQLIVVAPEASKGESAAAAEHFIDSFTLLNQ